MRRDSWRRRYSLLFILSRRILYGRPTRAYPASLVVRYAAREGLPLLLGLPLALWGIVNHVLPFAVTSLLVCLARPEPDAVATYKLSGSLLVNSKALLGNVFTQGWPHVLVDNHTTDGADYQHDLDYGIAHGPACPKPVEDWLVTAFEGRVVPRTKVAAASAIPVVTS